MGIFQRKLNSFLEAFLVSMIIGLIIPVVFFLRNLFTGSEYFVWYFFMGFVFTFTVSFCIYYFNVSIVRNFQKNEKSFHSAFLRIFIELCITTSIAGLVMAGLFYVFGMLSEFEPTDSLSALFDNILIAVIVNLVTLTIVETLFYFNKWRHSLVETEQLRRQNIEVQYAALTSQINPHFLFNSMNTLSSLINEDKKKALKFTGEFSRIYRYVLESKDKYLVSLNDELSFINSFFFLQKIRFNEALMYKTEIDVSCLEYFLPPLSLQLLVENAIKHNQISERNPLSIEIIGSDKQITVINNFQPLEKNEPHEGIGLKNLTDRYSHFTGVKPIFKIENNKYIAIIPLIEDE